MLSKKLRNTKRHRTPWQRMALSMFGVVVIGGSWHIAIGHLYTLKPEALAAFTTITTNAFYVVAAIVIFMVTGRLVYEWKVSTSEQLVEAGAQAFQEERTPSPKHFDDGSAP